MAWTLRILRVLDAFYIPLNNTFVKQRPEKRVRLGNMEQLIPCYFPSFSVSTTQARHLESSSLTLSDRDAGQLVSAASTHTLDALFRTAWALVLRCYTGSDEVCFGYQSSGRQENRHSLSSSPPVPISAVCISLSDRDRLDDIAHRSRLHDVSIDAMQGVYPFNTVILLRENVSANFGSPSLIEQSENDVHSLPEKVRLLSFPQCLKSVSRMLTISAVPYSNSR